MNAPAFPEMRRVMSAALREKRLAEGRTAFDEHNATMARIGSDTLRESDREHYAAAFEEIDRLSGTPLVRFTDDLLGRAA